MAIPKEEVMLASVGGVNYFKEVLTYQRDLHFCLHIDQKTNKQNIKHRKIESMTHMLWIDMEFLNLATILLRHRNATFTIVVSFHRHWERTQPL